MNLQTNEHDNSSFLLSNSYKILLSHFSLTFDMNIPAIASQLPPSIPIQ